MSDSSILKAGQLVGQDRFTLIKELGRGGMGVVWLAQDTSLDEQVALKFLPAEVCHDPVALNDLRRETVRSHRLTHPNIIRIHDFHQQPDGDAFISMEYVDGPTLSGFRLQQPRQVFAWETLAPLVKQLCTALTYAHGESVIHRDLKPANVMLDSRGRVKLADFGIAAAVSSSMSRVTSRASSGGTLAYMSPQQLRGQLPAVADDVYALGASLYELLTGRPPFYTGDITHQVLNEAPTPVSVRLLNLGVENAVPLEVAKLVLDCLSKDSAQRPASIEAAAKLAESAKPVPAAKPESPKLWRKIAVAAVLALGLGMAAWEYLPPLPAGTGEQPPVPKVQLTPVEDHLVRFTQPFLVHGPGGTGDLLTNTDLTIVVQCRNSASNAPVGLDGQVLLKDLPATWKNQEASVSISHRDWRLAGATESIRLSGDRIALALERRDVLIHGQVSASDSNTPLSGVVVSVAGVTNLSDALGQFNLTIPGRLARLDMTLTAQRPRYQPFSRTLTNLTTTQLVVLVALPTTTPTPPALFTQVLLLHGPGGTNDLPGSGDVEMLLQSGGRAYHAALTKQGEAIFTNLPAMAKHQSAEVSLSAKAWQVAGGTNLIQLSGQRLAVALERRGIVVRGSVTATNSAKPLPEALVAIGGVTNATDQSGRFAVSFPGRLLGSPLPITVTLSEYQPFSGKIADPVQEQAVSLSPAPPPTPLTRPTEDIVRVPAPGGGPITGLASSITATSPPPDYTYTAHKDYQSLLDLALQASTNSTRKSLKKADELSMQAVTQYRVLPEKEFAKYGTAFAIALLRRAEILALIPNDIDAGECYREAKGVCLKLGSNNPSGVHLARAFNNYAMWLSEQKGARQNPRVVDAYQQAITVFSNAVPLVATEALSGLANTYRNLGMHQKEVEDFAGAIASYQEAVRIYQALPASQEAELISRKVQAQRELASTLGERGQREAARTNYLAASAACEGLRPANQRLYRELLASVQTDYALSFTLSDPMVALLAYERAISLYGELARDSSWSNHKDFASTLNNYAVLLARPGGTNRAPEAVAAYQKALSQSRLAEDRPLEVLILRNHGRCLENQNRLTDARDMYRAALKAGAHYLDKQPAEIGYLLAEVHLTLAELELDRFTPPDQKERRSQLQTAVEEVKEARKLIKKYPAIRDQTYLESWGQTLSDRIAQATP